jgi:hypothetical protein
LGPGTPSSTEDQPITPAQADSCPKVLGDHAIEKLEAALGDSGSFDGATWLLMAAHDSGVDLDYRHGIEAWLRSIQSKPTAATPR